MNRNKLRAILVDDEQEAINYLSTLLEEYDNVDVIKTFTDYTEAIDEIIVSKPNLLFLDIQMPGKTGFDLLHEVKSENYLPTVVFITAFEKYAIEAIKNSAFDFLLKPVNKDELGITIKKIIEQNRNADYSIRLDKLISKLSKSRKVKFNTSTGFIVIEMSDIIYCEAHRNYCEIILRDNRREVVTINMNKVHMKLETDDFFRISRSNVINLKYLTKVERRNRICYLKENGEDIQIKISPSGLKILEKYLTKD